MFSTLKTINEYVLVEMIKPEDKTSGGIIIPDQAQEKSQQGIVKSPGSSKHLKEGDKVVFKKYFGTNITDILLVLKEEDILGVL